MIPEGRNLLTALTIAVIPATIASALEIRDYVPARHDRFRNGADGLEFNPDAYYGAANYAAIAFATGVNDLRQFALVTPSHVLFARHFAFGGNIRFINAAGVEIDRTLVENIEVPNDSGGISDLMIITLDRPVSEVDGIVPFPYPNLVNEATLTGAVVTTFGQSVRAGRGLISNFSDFSQTGPPAIDSTRTFTFRHNVFAGNDDDAVAVIGDSGSPTFAMVNGRPALIGVHLAASQGTFTNTTQDTYVPHYAETVNGLLAPSGYQLIPSNPAEVSLAVANAGEALRQATPGSIQITLSNRSAATATNVRLDLEFPPGSSPNSISSPGWIVENPSPGDFRLRTATLSGNSSETLTAAYSSVPVVDEIEIQATHRSDGSAESSRDLSIQVLPTFAGFVSNVSEKGETDDPDIDGFGNLIEYAFGGDPSVSSQIAGGGYSLAPEIRTEDGEVEFSFPKRTDAAERGLEYILEFSETLDEGSWSSDTADGFQIRTSPFESESVGFEMVTATFLKEIPGRNFVRVAVRLSE